MRVLQTLLCVSVMQGFFCAGVLQILLFVSVMQGLLWAGVLRMHIGGYKCNNVNWVHKHTTSKRMELESPGCLGYEALSISFITGTNAQKLCAYEPN